MFTAMRSPCVSSLICALLLGPAYAPASAQNPVPRPDSPSPQISERRTPPKIQVIPEPRLCATFLIEGRRVLGFDGGGAGMRRPFLYPVIGPSGLPLTRMGHPHDPVSHSHHNSVWISHNAVDGTDFWADNGGTIETIHISRLEDSDDHAWLEFKAVWRNREGAPLLDENRRITLTLLGAGLWRVDVEMELACSRAPVPLGATAFGFLGVRMAKTIGVRDGGGRILNSHGALNEAGCFRKPACWVDYSGPVNASDDEGITLMDHPRNLNHPVEFHVRNDGWMGASTTLRQPHLIEPGSPLRLKYGLLIHTSKTGPAEMQAEWERFSQTPFGSFEAKKR